MQHIAPHCLEHVHFAFVFDESCNMTPIVVGDVDRCSCRIVSCVDAQEVFRLSLGSRRQPWLSGL